MDEGQTIIDPDGTAVASAAPVEAQIASLRRRAAAWAVDASLATALLGLPVMLLMFAEPTRGFTLLLWTVAPTQATPDWLLWATGLNWLLAALIFVAILGIVMSRPGRWHGQTPGLRLAGMRVVQRDGSPITTSQAWTRGVWTALVTGLVMYAFGPMLDALLGTAPHATVTIAVLSAGLFCVALILAQFGGAREMLQDRRSATVVIRTAARANTVTITPGAAPRPADAAGDLPHDATVQWVPRPVTAGTRLSVGLYVLVEVSFAVLAITWSAVQPSRDEYRALLDEPKGQQARELLAVAEAAAQDCLNTGLNLIEDCDAAGELDIPLRVGETTRPEVGILGLVATRDLEGLGEISDLSALTSGVVFTAAGKRGHRWQVLLDADGLTTRTCRLPSGKTCPGVPPLGW